MSLQEPNFPSEMGNIPYDEIIGGPLNAAVTANAEASRTAANFIRDVAFEQNDTFSFSNARTPRYVTFNYSKTVTDENGNNTEEEFQLEIPFLLLLHVPYFEVERVTVDFNVKLNSVRKRMISEDGGGGLDFGGSIPWFSANASYQRTDKRSQTVERTYDQTVHVEAGSIEPPEGVTRLLDVLEETITEQGSGAGNSNNGSNNGNSSG